MTLPVPNLDDRRFQDLVDEAKRIVQQRCPEWTDHNVSDPGVTLIETFAFMVDQLLYRLNRVPDRNYVKFLELMGVRLFAPVAARVPVTFWLSAPQRELVRVRTGTEVATVRTETEDAVVFSVLEDLDIVPCSLDHLLSQPAGGQFQDHADSLLRGPGIACFSPVPQHGDALYVGLSDPVPRCAVALRFDCRIEGVGVDPRHPPLRWEAHDGSQWVHCELERDDTGGLNRPGDVILHVPGSHTPSVLNQQRGGWLRAVVVEAVPNQPVYSSSPRIDGLSAFTVGGTITASHAALVEGEIVGVSEGVPGQKMATRQSPILAGGEETVVEVGGGDDGWVEWSEVDNLADSSADDRHFVLERRTGQIEFGPAVRLETGDVVQFGGVPPKAATVRVRRYQTGGGSGGNVAPGAVTVMKSTIPFVARVVNRRAAAGGVDAETIEEAKVRGPIQMRTRNRAVTALDYEQLAKEAAPEVSRVRCVPVAGADHEGGVAGVRVLVVPTVDPGEDGRLRFEQLMLADDVLQRIVEHLDERRVIAARVTVEPPHYQGITVVARVRARHRARSAEVERSALRSLYRYYDPIVGGPDGSGWPFGRPMHVGEVYAVLQRLDGVDFIEEAFLFGTDPLTGDRGPSVDRIELDPSALVFSYEHLMRVERS